MFGWQRSILRTWKEANQSVDRGALGQERDGTCSKVLSIWFCYKISM